MLLLLLLLTLKGCKVRADAKAAYLINQFLDAHTAYGPGLGVFTPYWYADISYDNIPFVGKLASGGKEGTSSRLRISPLYPESGNPSNPFPPLYRARPLPPHVPEPVDVVAVVLDEEALHGEPLFPKELTLPSEMEFAGKTGETDAESIKDPFGDISEKSAWTPEMIELKSKKGKKKVKTQSKDRKGLSKEEARPANPFGDISTAENDFSAQGANSAALTDEVREATEARERIWEWSTDSDGHIVWNPGNQPDKTRSELVERQFSNGPSGFIPTGQPIAHRPPKNPFTLRHRQRYLSIF